MGIVCLGACEVDSSGNCPKRLPPVFNPTPAFLLDMLFPSSQNPEKWKWEQVRALLASQIDRISSFMPTSIQERDGLWGRVVVDWIKRRDMGTLHGALAWPAGVRALSREMDPEVFVEAVEAVRDGLKSARDAVGGFRGEGTASYDIVLAQMTSIGSCARANLGHPQRLVIVYGW